MTASGPIAAWRQAETSHDPSLSLAFDIAALFRLRIEDVFERGKAS